MPRHWMELLRSLGDTVDEVDEQQLSSTINWSSTRFKHIKDGPFMMACGMLYANIYRVWTFPTQSILHKLCNYSQTDEIIPLAKFFEVEISQEFYRIFSRGTLHDWQTRCNLVHMGNTSFSMENVMRIQDEVIGKQRFMVVRMNNRTKTTEPIPDDMKEKKSLLAPDSKPASFPPISVPDRTPDAVFEFTISEGCIDQNNHVNVTVYLWIFAKAIETAESKNLYKNLGQESLKPPSLRIKRCSVIFDKEVLLGEKIMVDTWLTDQDGEQWICARLGMPVDPRVLMELELYT